MQELIRLTSSAPFEPTSLYRIGVRINRRRRALIVSTVLAKHIPVDGRVALAVARTLARKIRGGIEEERTTRDLAVALADPVQAPLVAADVSRLSGATVLGFCETAVGLGASVAEALSASYLHSTRHPRPGQRALTWFAEEHSHAPGHVVAHRDANALSTDSHVVLVDDELTTGNTALAAIRKIQSIWPKEKFTLAVLMDWRSADDEERFDRAVNELGVIVDVVSLYRADSRQIQVPDPVPIPGSEGSPGAPGKVMELRLPEVEPASPFASGASSHRESARAISEMLQEFEVGAVVGTEECIFLPTLVAAELGVTVQSSTLSPVLVSHSAGYPIRSAVEFPSPYQRCTSYAYNLPRGRTLAVLADGGDALAHRRAAEIVADHTGAPVVLVLTGSSGRNGVSTFSFPGSVCSTYDSKDVEFAIADIGDVPLEAPLVSRELRMQRGGHYSEVLPVEHAPSDPYLELFRSILSDTAAEVAAAVARLAERIISETPEPVLVSLARAGTPIGVLVGRYLRRVGVEAPHYTISIIRDRGIDQAAVRHIREHHPDRQIRFVDGWTGKGVIASEVARACSSPGPAYGLDANLAVVADPGFATRTFGTRDDLLVPSACLNSTVSGLVSRTVFRPDLTGGGHGAKFYRDLVADDMSALFVDTVEAAFPARGESVFGAAQLEAAAAEADWRGWRSVLRIGEEFGIDDVNRIKPGVGETLRVLLRRDPWAILVSDADDRDLRPIVALAAEKDIPIVAYREMSYKACGLIRSV